MSWSHIQLNIKPLTSRLWFWWIIKHGHGMLSLCGSSLADLWLQIRLRETIMQPNKVHHTSMSINVYRSVDVLMLKGFMEWNYMYEVNPKHPPSRTSQTYGLPLTVAGLDMGHWISPLKPFPCWGCNLWVWCVVFTLGTFSRSSLLCLLCNDHRVQRGALFALPHKN